MDRREAIITGAYEMVAQERPNLTTEDFARRIDLLHAARTEPAAPWEDLVAQAIRGL